MDLQPKLPPGRANRKALAYADDILRLRAAGYSFDAIRLALLEAGVQVSRTTVKREAKRRPMTTKVTQRLRALHTAPPPTAMAHSLMPVETRTESPGSGSYTTDARSGREIAKAFFDANPSNPLLRAKETS